jgi:predicted AlkP superfamily phosphohydrolase/phosphomutase
MSDHGARALDGGFCVNEWLVQNGLLVLKERPSQVTSFAELDVDWSKTMAWSEGGYYGRIFFNVKGREPQGLVEPDDYESVRDELRQKLESVLDDTGKPMGTKVFKPDQIYRDVRNISPDLLVHFGELAWRAIGGVGYDTVYVQENDTGPDDCNHAQFGAFVLASSNNPLQGKVEGVRLLDLAPTLLELADYDIPGSMQGLSLVQGKPVSMPENTGLSAEGEEAVKRRLSGLGYIS